MADVASLAVGLHINAANFRTQLQESFNTAETRSNTFNRRAQNEAKKTEAAYKGVTTSVLGLGVRLAGLAGMGLSFGSIINTTRKYGQALSDLSAITGVTTERLAAFNNAAKEMSRTTKYGVTEAVEALNLMAASKPELVKTAGSLESVTKSALTLAQASGMDLNSAVNAVSLSLNQFGASASEADRFINVLAAGSRAGRSDIDSTTQAIKNSGVAASQSKIPFEQLNAAIQTLSESGIKGSKAGTDFSKVLLRLERSTDASLKPSVVGLDVALDNLAKKNLSTTQAMKLFGIQNVTTASILVNNRARLSELKNELTGTNTAYEQAATRINNLNGDIAGLSGAFEGAAIAIGNSANGPLRKGVQSATSAINYLSDNFSAVSDIALYTLVPILANKLTAGLRTSATAWISNEVAMKKAATQQVATANATIASSQATRAQAIAQNQWMATQSVINRQNGLAVSYQAAYARNARLITEATIAETAAKRQLAVANSQLAITSRAAAASGGLMRSALGFVGGPTGIAVMAAAGLAMFAASAISAKNPTDDFSASVRQLTSDLRTLQLDEVNEKIAKGNELLGDARNRWKALEFAKNNGGDVPKFAADKVDSDISQLTSDLDQLEKRKEEINNQPTIKPDFGGVGAGSAFDGISGGSRNTLDKFQKFRVEMEISNASSLQKIDLQEQEAKQKLLELAKKHNASQAEVEGLSIEITSKYAKDRLKLADQYAPGKLLSQQTSDTNNILKELYSRDLLNTQEYYRAKQNLYVESTRQRIEASSAAAVDPMDRLRADVDPTVAIQNEYTQKMALLEAYRQEEVIRAEGHAQKITDIEKRYGELRVKAELDRTQKLEQSSAQVAQTMFSVTTQFASLTADVMQNAGQENTTAMKVLLAVQKALAIPSIIVQTQVAAAAARAHGSMLGGYLSGETAAKMVEMQGAISVGIVAGQALSGMAHDGIDNVPKEGTWLLDRGERVVDSRTNEDLKNYLKNQNAGSSKSEASNSTQIVIDAPIYIEAGKAESSGISSEDAKQVSILVKSLITERLNQETRSGGLLNRG